MGSGSWGTAIADLLCGKGHDVVLWARRSQVSGSIARDHKNPFYLSDRSIHPAVKATSDFEAALAGADLIVLAVPSHAMRDTSLRLADALSRSAEAVPALVSLAKGIEAATLMRMSEVLAQCLPAAAGRLAVLSGPNHAEEVIRGIPTATVISSSDQRLAAELQDIFMTPLFRVYTNRDLVGVELGGACKNVIALAAGVSDGLGFGDNTKASLMTRGLAEMARLGTAMGASARTFSGLSGLGDLIVTCVSAYSRNRLVGQRLGKGERLADIMADMRMVAEGVRTAPAILELAARHGVELPIATMVTELLAGRKEPDECVTDLMSRGAGAEFEGW